MWVNKLDKWGQITGGYHRGSHRSPTRTRDKNQAVVPSDDIGGSDDTNGDDDILSLLLTVLINCDHQMTVFMFHRCFTDIFFFSTVLISIFLTHTQ